ncbi:unnamed protein product [Durusdinium trenchii]|uniref:Ubiquitin-like domain-containing protein n=1 Tax=Durusdinium trenchii TaxID=1381693 RepID=A0ABP0SXX9_9DINO
MILLPPSRWLGSDSTSGVETWAGRVPCQRNFRARPACPRTDPDRRFCLVWASEGLLWLQPSVAHVSRSLLVLGQRGLPLSARHQLGACGFGRTLYHARTPFRCASVVDGMIQVWVRVPKGKLAFWVPPNLPLGPASAQVEESTCGRDTPLRRLLTQLNEESFVDEKELRSANFEMASQEHVQSTAKLSGPTVSQMSPTLSSTTLSDVESSFKSLIQAATGVPMSQQKLFFGPSGLLEDNSKALFQYEIGQGAMVHLSTRRDPELVAQFYEDARRSKRKGKKTYHGLENPRHLLDNRIFDRIRQFMNTKVGSKMGKDLVMIVPDWKKAGVVPLEYEWPHEQPWHDYKLMPDNGIFDFAGRIRKKFHLLPRLAGAAASPKLIEAHAVSMQRTGILSNDASPRADDG